MRAEVYIVREVISKNKKAAAEKPWTFKEEPAISIKTYLGIIRAKKVTFKKNATLIQSIEDAVCSGATVFIIAEFEDLIIDGVEANRKMFAKQTEQVLVGDSSRL